MLTKRYTDFDGHTTSNCCHGMALLSWHLIQMTLELDLPTLKQEYEYYIHSIEQNTCPKKASPCTGHAPKALINLTCLYILSLVREFDPEKGGRTVMKKLKILAPISGNACKDISNSMQKVFSNWTAMSYSSYLKKLNKTIQVSGAPAALWGKYIKPEFIRSDKHGVKYASNLFSMQVTLAYLSQSRAKVALINDMQNILLNQSIERYKCLFQGDGQGGFYPITHKKLDRLQISQDEPVVVLGGCTYSDRMNKDSLALRMQHWLGQLTQLILACDVFYPQFLNISDDPEFISSPIVPIEFELMEIINSYINTQGVSIQDPSLFCLTHIFPCSLHQYMDCKADALPISFIPHSQR